MTDKKIRASREADVEKLRFAAGMEHGQRIVTTKREGSETFSFHIATYEPGFDTFVKGDEHEFVLYCLEGDSRQILEDGTEIEFVPGTATYVPRGADYRHVIGPNGLKAAVACNPPRE